jgi:hypothetical protein
MQLMVARPSVNLQYQKIVDQLSSFPALQVTFKHCLLFSYKMLELDIAIKGSLVSGEVDALSDIDLCINISNEDELLAVQLAFVEHMQEFAEVYTWFRAEHINMPNLLVFFLKVDDELVKVDAEIVCLQKQSQVIPQKFLVLRDKSKVFETQPKEKQDEFDLSLMYRKFCAWQWFIYCKIARGELFHAARSIDFSRENALLVLIRVRLNLPALDGHRRIEQLLPQVELEQLNTTYPTCLSQPVLLECLAQLSNVFELHWLELIKVEPIAHDSYLLGNINLQIQKHKEQNS